MGANDIIGPNGGTPAFNGGSFFNNLTTSINRQIKTGAGVFSGLGVNTGGTTSSVAMYDGASGVFTVTIATPGVFTKAAHGLLAGTAIKLTTTGALPTGLTANTTVYVSTAGLAANTFRVADTEAHALAGTNTINTSGSQSGVQTLWDVSRPIGTYGTTVQISLPVAAAFTRGLIAIAADGGGAANLTVLYV